MNFSTFNQALEPMFGWTWRNSLSSGVLILLVFLVQFLFSRVLSARWRYALGILVLVRLMMPMVPASSFSIFNLTREVSANATLPPPPDIPITPSIGQVPLPDGGISSTKTGPSRKRQLNILAIAKILWLGGLFGSLFVAWRQHRRFSLRVEVQPPMSDARIRSLLEKCKSVVGVRRRLEIVAMPGLGTPALFGFWNPRLLLPEGLAQKLGEAELRMVFLHELVHLKRSDILLNWVIIFVRSVHWFNPLVWLAMRRLRADRELVCDAMVMARLAPDDRRVYGHTLVKLLDDFSGAGFCPSLVPVINHKNEIKRRVTMIAKFKPASRIALLFSATLIIALCSFTFTRAAEKNANPSSIENPAGKGNANPSAVKPQSTTVATMKALKKQLTEQDEKLKEAQDRLDAMIHKQKDISDFGLDPENSVSTETIRHLEADRITLDSSCRQMELLLAEVQKLSPRDLPKVMDVVYPDQILTSLKEAQALCDRNLAGLRSNFGEEHQEVRHAKSIRDNLEQQINERVSGILRGLAVKIDALKAQRDSATRSLESARERREKTLVSKFRPYLDAQSEVEKLRRDRDAIQFRLVQENLDADLSKAKPGEKITR